eukprot:7832946-Alexandrium_andersonii.AAC.1
MLAERDPARRAVALVVGAAAPRTPWLLQLCPSGASGAPRAAVRGVGRWGEGGAGSPSVQAFSTRRFNMSAFFNIHLLE